MHVYAFTTSSCREKKQTNANILFQKKKSNANIKREENKKMNTNANKNSQDRIRNRTAGT